MTINAEGKHTNIEKSLTAWIRAKLVTIESLSVFFGDEPIDDRPASWVHVDYLLDIREEFGRNAAGATHANRMHSILNINLCQERQTLSNIYAMATLRDAVRPYFRRGQTIPILDYDTGGTPEVGRIDVHDVTQADVDTGLESGVITQALSVNISSVETYTLV